MAGKTLEEWKSEINWNKSGNADIECQYKNVSDQRSDHQTEKHREFMRIEFYYKQCWSSLEGPISGVEANFIIAIDRSLGYFVRRLEKLSELLDLTRPNPESQKTLEDRGILTGCEDAAETTYTNIIAGIMPRYWKVALIRITGHSAVVVYDDEIGKGETYVFDPWKTQTPEVYTWESWPFNEFLKSRYSVIKKYEYPVK